MTSHLTGIAPRIPVTAKTQEGELVLDLIDVFTQRSELEKQGIQINLNEISPYSPELSNEEKFSSLKDESPNATSNEASESESDTDVKRKSSKEEREQFWKQLMEKYDIEEIDEISDDEDYKPKGPRK